MSKIILVDTQEQQPWDFAHSNWPDEIKAQKLPTGDYTLESLENLICVERKKSVAELAQNITQKRFQNEIERMTKFKYPYLLLEFDLSHIYSFPLGSGLPKRVMSKIRVRGSFIIKKLIEYQVQYNIKVIPCGHREFAQSICIALFKEMFNKHA